MSGDLEIGNWKFEIGDCDEAAYRIAVRRYKSGISPRLTPHKSEGTFEATATHSYRRTEAFLMLPGSVR